MKTMHFCFGLLLTLFLAAGPVLGLPAQAQAPVTVRLVPASLQAEIGQVASLAVEVADVQNLYGMDIELTFDPALVEVVDADPKLEGVQVSLGTFLDPGFVVINQADNSTGRLRLTMTQLNPSTPKSGSGTLVVLQLKVKQAGVTRPIELVRGDLAAPDGAKFEAALVSGAVEGLQNLAGPTQTLIPSQAPGTPMPSLTPTGGGSNPQAPGVTVTTATPAPTQMAATATQPARTAAPSQASPTQALYTQPALAAALVAAAPTLAVTEVVAPTESASLVDQPASTAALPAAPTPTETALPAPTSPAAAPQPASPQTPSLPVLGGVGVLVLFLGVGLMRVFSGRGKP